MSAPSPKQLQVLTYIKDHLADCGYQPSFAEMATHFGYKSQNSITLYLDALERQGLIVRAGQRSRAIIITDAGLAA